MYGGARHRPAVKPPQVVGNLAGPEVIVLAEVEDLAHDVGRRRPRRAVRRPSPAGQSDITLLEIPVSPLVERLPRNPEMPTGPRHIACTRGGLEHLQAPVGQPPLL